MLLNQKLLERNAFDSIAFFSQCTLMIFQIEPTWKMKQQFVLAQQNAFGFDALPSSEPMTKSVQSQLEIKGMTGAISSYKGGSILRMLELSFGANIFNSATELYLKARLIISINIINIKCNHQITLSNVVQKIRYWKTRGFLGENPGSN